MHFLWNSHYHFWFYIPSRLPYWEKLRNIKAKQFIWTAFRDWDLQASLIFSKDPFEDTLYFLITHVFPRKLSSSVLALYVIQKWPSAKALCSVSKITSLLIDNSLLPILNFWIKIFAELLSLLQIRFLSFIISIIDKLLARSKTRKSRKKQLNKGITNEISSGDFLQIT